MFLSDCEFLNVCACGLTTIFFCIFLEVGVLTVNKVLMVQNTVNQMYYSIVAGICGLVVHALVLYL